MFLTIAAVDKDIKSEKKKKKIADNHLHNILRLLMFYQIFLSLQVKWCAIITYKHGIYELPCELLNDL